MANLTILRKYAQNLRPESLPTSVLFSHTDNSLTIFDAYPKSIFHFLILPAIKGSFTVQELGSLKTLLKGDKERAKAVITALNNDAKVLRKEIEDEMVSRYGFKWDIWTGFHAAPSMDHLHLHVLSADLCSDKMKNKKHYNSFHPKLGFFLTIEEVLSWFDAEPSFYMTIRQLKPNDYEPLLKDTLTCFSCNAEIKNMPALKVHLQEEWEKLKQRKTDKFKRKVRGVDDIESEASPFKKVKADS